MTNRPEETFYDRLMSLIGTEEPFRFAKRVGIPNGTFARMLSTKSIPKQAHLCRIATVCGVSVDWLLLGTEKTSENGESLLPVVGFASCGLTQGWFDEQKIRVVLPFPMKNVDKNAFAVICRGSSMVPEGISDGDVCVVSPSGVLQKGKPVFVRTKSTVRGKTVLLSSVKRFEGKGKGVVRLCGWLDPDENGCQDPFFEERTESVVKDLFPVVKIMKNEEVFGGAGGSDSLRRDVLVACFDSLKPFLADGDSDHLAGLFQLFYQRHLKEKSAKTGKKT